MNSSVFTGRLVAHLQSKFHYKEKHRKHTMHKFLFYTNESEQFNSFRKWLKRTFLLGLSNSQYKMYNAIVNVVFIM